jgi:NTE family protein
MGNRRLRLELAGALIASCFWGGAGRGWADTAPEPPQNPAAAQLGASPQGSSHPRICLVLSGGGARGMAHIGVLKVIEDLKIPIDCIAGTSMGAVVGGLYASGMTAAQIESTMRTVDWQEAFRDAPPRRDLAFRRKQDDRNFLVRLPLGLKHRQILLPKGFIQGQRLQETLRQLTLPFSNSTNFDQLPTPFRAVATDLETGAAVVIDKGDLSIAMRASISAPGVFAPVDFEGRLLVDGGLAENLPINVARKMNADILIVSDVSFPLQPRDRLDSALSISNQMLAILVRKDSDRQKATLGPRDVLIEPALGTALATDFTIAASSIAQGKAAALAVAPRLEALRVDDRVYRAYAARRATRQPEAPVIKFVRVDAESKRYEKTILAEMQSLVGEPLDLDAVGARITNLYGLGYFETVDYTLVEQGEGAGEEYGLEVRVRRKSWGPTYVRFGLSLQDDFQGNSQYNAAAEFLMTEINDLGAELLTDVQIGSDPKLSSEFYQPLDALRKWFVAPSARIEARDLPIYENNHQIADFRDREVEADLDVGRTLGNWGEIRAGLHRINGQEYDRWGNPDLVDPQYNNGEFFFKFSYDQLDNVHFPRAGQSFDIRWDANRTDLGADIASDRVTVDWLAAGSSGRNTVLLWTSAGATLDGRVNPTDVQDFYSLGGFLNLSGLAPQSLLGPNFAIARAIYFRKIGRGGEGFFEFPAYIGASLEIGNTWERRSEISYASAHKDASLFIAFDTFLGPVYLGTGYDQSGNAAYYLFLGRTF